MPALILWALGHVKLIGYLAALVAVVLFVGWLGHLKHELDSVPILKAQIVTDAKTNADTIAAFDQKLASIAKADAIVAEGASIVQHRSVAIAAIHQENARVVTTPDHPLAHVRCVLGGLRGLGADYDSASFRAALDSACPVAVRP